MPWGKGDEEDPADGWQRQLQARQDEAQQAREAFLNTPVGQATEAKERGDRFFEAQFDTAQPGGASTSGSSNNRVRRSGGISDVLERIEDIGWRLEHVSHTFVQNAATTTNRTPETGQGVVTRGVATGFYLFRNATERQ